MDTRNFQKGRQYNAVSRLGAGRPSSTRIKKMSDEVEARRAGIDLHYAGATRSRAATEERRSKKDSARLRNALGLGALAAMGLTAFAITANQGRNSQPVNVNKLPAKDITRVYVGPDSDSHSAAGVAGDVVNDSTRVEQVTAEIEKEVGGETVPSGTVLKLPTDQIDSAAVETYEHGPNG